MGRPESAVPMQRMNLALPVSSVARIDRLMVVLGASTRTEVIRRALEEYEVLTMKSLTHVTVKA